jgi:hypothetical protein
MLKYFIYIILFIAAISYLQPNIATSIREYLIQMIKSDGTIFTNIFSIIGTKIKEYFFYNLISNSNSSSNTSTNTSNSSPNNYINITPLTES